MLLILVIIELFLIAILVAIVWGLHCRITKLADMLCEIRKELYTMSDQIASLELIKTLARAVVSAQESEKDAENAREVAQQSLAQLKQQVTLDAEAEELVSRALGNAVHADPEQGEPIVDENQNGIDDREETAAEDTGDQTSIDDAGEVEVDNTDSTDVSADTDENTNGTNSAPI